MGRPPAIFDRDLVIRLRDHEHLSWPQIARRMGAGVGTVVRAYRDRNAPPQPFQKYQVLELRRRPSVTASNGSGRKICRRPNSFRFSAVGTG
jgi:DNA-binding transcriptional regulator YiaG